MANGPSNKTPSVISTVLTVIFLLVIAVMSVFFEMVALNGASEKQGTMALVISLVCNGLGVILLGIFSGRFTRHAITKFKWNNFLAIVITVILGTAIGTAVSFLSVISSIILAGIK